MTYNAHGERTSIAHPLGNLDLYLYDDVNPDRFQQGNLLSETKLPDGRGGDQTHIQTRYTYEPLFNQVLTTVYRRGNDPTYIPQNGGVQSTGRYTTTYTY